MGTRTSLRMNRPASPLLNPLRTTARRVMAFEKWASALFLVLLPVLVPAEARATPLRDATDLCEKAAREASRQTGVPFPVLWAVTLTETGRPSDEQGGHLAPWPWAANQAGEGNWFATQDEVLAYAEQTLANGYRNIDLGCFQLNYRWHGAAFPSLAAMVDPVANAVYAAALLKGHYDTLGDWSLAAGAYHSQTPEYAERYRARFDEIYTALPGTDAPHRNRLALVADRVNGFPLLQAGETGARGSLVPLLTAGRPLIGGQP